MEEYEVINVKHFYLKMLIMFDVLKIRENYCIAWLCKIAYNAERKVIK